MAIKANSLKRYSPGATGCSSEVVSFKFDGDSILAQVSTNFTRVIGINYTVIGDIGADGNQQLFLDEAIDSDGIVTVSDGVLNVRRTTEGGNSSTSEDTSVTADLAVILEIKGF